MLNKKKVCDAGHFKCLTREVGNAGDLTWFTAEKFVTREILYA